MEKRAEEKFSQISNEIRTKQYYRELRTNLSLINGTKDVVFRLRKYGYTDNFVPSAMKQYIFFLNHGINFTAEDMFKIAELVEFILKCYGYNDEEIVNYFKRNNRIVLSSYLNFVRRLSIFNHFGYMDESIFDKWTLLTDENALFSSRGISELYVICNGVTFESLDELKEIFTRIPDSRLEELMKLYPLNSEIRKQLDIELSKTLKKLKFKSDMESRKRKLQKDSVN